MCILQRCCGINWWQETVVVSFTSGCLPNHNNQRNERKFREILVVALWFPIVYLLVVETKLHVMLNVT